MNGYSLKKNKWKFALVNPKQQIKETIDVEIIDFIRIQSQCKLH